MDLNSGARVQEAVADLATGDPIATWRQWQHEPGYLTAAAELAGSGNLDMHTWTELWLEHPDQMPQPDVRDSSAQHATTRAACDILHGTYDHAVTSGTWGDRHQQLAAHFEARLDSEARRDWRLHIGRLHDDHPDVAITSAAELDLERGPAGAQWATVDVTWLLVNGHHDIAAARDLTDEELTEAASGAHHLPIWFAEHVARHATDDDTKIRAVLATDQPRHIARWLSRHPEHATRAHQTLNLASSVAVYEAALADHSVDITACDPVLVADLRRYVEQTALPAVVDRYPQLNCDTARALWDSWDGTIGELAGTVEHLNAAPARTNDA